MEENNYTLEQMRADYQTLKNTLENQEIVNDRLLREAMKGKVSSIRTKATLSIACALFVIAFAPFAFHYNPGIQASWWFVGATVLMMIACIFFDYKFNHKVQSADLATCNLLTFTKDVKNLKENYRKWVKWGIIMVSAWIVWLGIEVWNHAEEPKFAIMMISAIIIGAAIGGIIGFSMNRKIINTCDEIINNIEK